MFIIVGRQYTSSFLFHFRELAASQDELKIASEQVTSLVETETTELRNTNEILMLELQQKEQELAKVNSTIEFFWYLRWSEMDSSALVICIGGEDGGLGDKPPTG